MKPTDTLTTLFSHHLWANLRLLERCADLTPDQMEVTMVGAYGSIYETLEHIVRSEKSYFTRISTGQIYRRPENPPRMAIADMIESMRETGTGLIEWASRVLVEETVEVDWDGTPRGVPKTVLLTQALFHAAEHREQIKSIMTQIGVEPPDLQGWEFFDQNYK